MFNSVHAMRALGRRSRVGGEHGRRGEQCDAREAPRPNVDELFRVPSQCTSKPPLSDIPLSRT
jgi:hypothetical protein